MTKKKSHPADMTSNPAEFIRGLADTARQLHAEEMAARRETEVWRLEPEQLEIDRQREMEARAQAMLADGTMPSFEEVQQAVAEALAEIRKQSASEQNALGLARSHGRGRANK